jgi:hypothetical protein
MRFTFGEVTIQLNVESSFGPFEDGLYEMTYVITDKDGSAHNGQVSHSRDEAQFDRAKIAKRACDEWARSNR